VKETDKVSGLPPAVVVGLDSVTGLQSARVLARNGVQVLGIARDPRHPCVRTRACARVVVADTTGDELVETLEKLGPDWSSPAVLLPCTDLSVLLISRNRETLRTWYRFALPDPHVVEMLVDKASFVFHAQKQGLPVPRSFPVRERREAVEVAGQLRFPCILKPWVKTAEWKKNTSAKAFKAFTAEELLVLFDRCSGWTDMLLVQEWVAGEETDLYTCNGYFDARANPLVLYTSRKLRQWPPGVGEGCLAEECQNAAVAEETVRMFRSVGLHGFGYLELKHDRQNSRYLIIEPNIGRPTGRAALADARGVPLLFTAYSDIAGLPLPAHSPQNGSRAKWIYLRRDLQAAYHHWRRGELSLKAWMCSLRNLKKDALFAWNDPAPFWLDLLAAAKKYRHGAASLNVPEGADVPGKPLERGEVRTAAASEPQEIDYDIHGIVGIKLIHPSPSDARAVAAQLGPMQRPLTRRPDIVVRFVRSLPTPDLRYVELHKSGFNSSGFFFLESKKRRARVKVEFDQLGKRCEMICESGLRQVPLLMAAVHLTALDKRWVPLHASAFVHEGVGILVTGWAKGGKTEALLAFARRGAQYVGDEWVLLDEDGQRMYGIPENIRLWDWHLENLPEARAHVGLGQRLFFRGVRGLDRLQARLPENGLGRFLPVRVVREAMPALRRQLNVQLPPQLVFGSGIGPFVGKPQKVFFMMSHEDPSIVVAPADPDEIAKQMAASVRYELLPLLANYLAYRFAFPERGNELIERAHEVQYSLLSRALAGKEAYVVRHPYPCSLDRLYEEMRPFCVAQERRAA